MTDIKLINKTSFKDKDILEISYALLEGNEYPDFYLLCPNNLADGITLTNLDKPTVIILITDLGRFAKVFVHEIEHLKQHQKGYVNEKEAETKEREIIVSDAFGVLIYK